jgi:hypothetical protein
MPNSLMDQAQLKQWILRRLGAPFVKVELSDDMLDDAVETARRWFSAKKGVKRQNTMPFFTGVPAYQLPDDVDIVLDVAFPVSPMDISLVFSPYILADEKVPYDVFAAPSAVGIYSSYTQTIQYVEQAKRILNAEADWRQDGRQLLLFPVPKSGGNIIYDYKSHDFTIEQLSERDHDLVKRYALAKAKEDLTQPRGKYAEFPGAQGTAHFNWEKTANEAKAELEALEKEIFQSAYPMYFIHG